jgi:hypothetical protein
MFDSVRGLFVRATTSAITSQCSTTRSRSTIAGSFRSFGSCRSARSTNKKSATVRGPKSSFPSPRVVHRAALSWVCCVLAAPPVAAVLANPTSDKRARACLSCVIDRPRDVLPTSEPRRSALWIHRKIASRCGSSVPPLRRSARVRALSRPLGVLEYGIFIEIASTRMI